MSVVEAAKAPLQGDAILLGDYHRPSSRNACHLQNVQLRQKKARRRLDALIAISSH